jgi:hypothetical protein
MNLPTYQDFGGDSSGVPRAPSGHEASALIPARIAQTHFPARKTSWDVALQQVAAHEASLDRQHCPLHEIHLQEDKLVVGDCVLHLDDDGFEQLCRPFKAPADYLARLSPNLRSGLVNHHLGHAASSVRLTDHNTIVLSRNGTFRGFDRGDLCRLPATEVLHAVRDGLQDGGAGLEIQALGLHDAAVQADVVGRRLTDEVRVGDVIRYGVRVRHSLVGDYATTIESFAFRLVCSNGLVQRQCLGPGGTARSRPRTRRLPGRFGNVLQQQREQVSRLAAEAWQRLCGMGHGIRALQQRHFDLANLQRFLRQARMHSGRLLKLVEAAWQAEGAEPTAFGFLNALTRVATHEAGLSAPQRRRLDLLAGVFAGQDVHLCPNCLSLIAG